jgi:hypothetical protein
VFKRLFWLTIGLLCGSMASFWFMAKLRERAARYRPERISANVVTAVRGVSDDVKASVADGVETMRQREAAIRGDLGC